MEIAVRICSFEGLKLLVEAGANMHLGDFMHHACEQDHIEMMKVEPLSLLFLACQMAIKKFQQQQE